MLNKKKTEAAETSAGGEWRYYEENGAIKAYANRSFAIAGISGLTTLVAVSLMAYALTRKPVVIAANPQTGEATVVGGAPAPGNASAGLRFVSDGTNVPPTDIDKQAIIKKFLNSFLNFTPYTFDSQIANALNLATHNYKQEVLRALEKADTGTLVQAQHIDSVFHLRTIDAIPNAPLTFIAYGTKIVHRTPSENESERTDTIVTQYTIRLAELPRSANTPLGLRVAYCLEQQLLGDKGTDGGGAAPLALLGHDKS